MGLPRSVAMVRLYPPEIKPPPAAMMSWNVFPLSVLNSNTPPSNPTFGSKSEASRLKLCRNVNRTQQSSKKLTNHPSSRLSLTTAGSSINRALGAVSAGGTGSPELDVTHSGGGPSAFVASQSGGNWGGVNPSKFSVLVRANQQSGKETVESVSGLCRNSTDLQDIVFAASPSFGAQAEFDSVRTTSRDDSIAPTTAMLAVTIKKQPRRPRSRDDPVVPFGLEIIEALDALSYPKPQESVNTRAFMSLSSSPVSRASREHALTNFRYGRGAVRWARSGWRRWHNDDCTGHTRRAVRETEVRICARLRERMFVHSACVSKRSSLGNSCR